jgi:hypothetical protein
LPYQQPTAAEPPNKLHMLLWPRRLVCGLLLFWLTVAVCTFADVTVLPPLSPMPLWLQLLAAENALWCILATFVRKLISPWFAEFTANAAGAAIAPTIDSAAIKAVVVLVIILCLV